MKIKSISVFVMHMVMIQCLYSHPQPCIPTLPNAAAKLTYAGNVYNIPGGFSCGSMTDDEVDAKLDNACNEKYPGSRNIRGVEIENGGYQNIIGLPAAPRWPFAPSCECGDGCGNSCDNPHPNSRLCSVYQPASWDVDNSPSWVENHIGFVLTAECVYSEIACPNPCISGNTAPQDLYHPSCKSCCRFIQCDAFGNAFDMPCGVGTYWDQALLTCDHNINQCTDVGCTQSPAAAHINPLMQNKNVNVEHKYYYGYITVIGVVAFILINNVFLGCWCLGKGRDKAHAKFDMVSVNDEI